MRKVLVYNPSSSPAVYGDGRIIGGQEWQEIELKHVDEVLAAGCILIPEEGEPVIDPQPSLIDDSFPADDAVSSAEAEVPESDAARTPRRARKSSPEKE